MQNKTAEISDKIESLDLSLFDHIQTESSEDDRKAWLAIQRALRLPLGYTYLEIGSHLGGSIQQHIIDPLCQSIISIDKRPLSQPDDRGTVFHYTGNSTQRMLDNLYLIVADNIGKVTCFDADVCTIDPLDLPASPDFCFIDGEHTYSAVLSDFHFCLRVCKPSAAICFHDDYIIYSAIRHILSELYQKGIPFVALKLPGTTFGIFLRNCPALDDSYITNHSLASSKWFRYQIVRQRVPSWLRPAAGQIARLFQRHLAGTLLK